VRPFPCALPVRHIAAARSLKSPFVCVHVIRTHLILHVIDSVSWFWNFWAPEDDADKGQFELLQYTTSNPFSHQYEWKHSNWTIALQTSNWFMHTYLHTCIAPGQDSNATAEHRHYYPRSHDSIFIYAAVSGVCVCVSVVVVSAQSDQESTHASEKRRDIGVRQMLQVLRAGSAQQTIFCFCTESSMEIYKFQDTYAVTVAHVGWKCFTAPPCRSPLWLRTCPE